MWKMLRVAILSLLLTSCCTFDAKIHVPPEGKYPPITGPELKSMGKELAGKVQTRDGMKDAYINRLRTLIKTTH